MWLGYISNDKIPYGAHLSSPVFESYVTHQVGVGHGFNNHVKHKESINLLLASDMLLLVIPKIANNKGILT
ncbi:hypothetical protein N9K77_01310 [bacterium]|nr:hypothetical protein [bacterium]